MIILKVTKSQGFTLSLEYKFLENPQGSGGSQTDLPPAIEKLKAASYSKPILNFKHPQKGVSSGAVVCRCSSKQLLLKFRQFHRKASVLESLFNSLANLLRISIFTEHLRWLLLKKILEEMLLLKLPATFPEKCLLKCVSHVLSTCYIPLSSMFYLWERNIYNGFFSFYLQT